MKKLMFIYFMLFWGMGYAFQYPQVLLFFNKTPPSTMYYGETLKIPIQMNYGFLRTYKEWTLPAGAILEVAGGSCPGLNNDRGNYFSGTCYMNIVIPGNALGKNIAGFVNYHVFGAAHRHDWNQNYTSPVFNVTVIPHPLSMSVIPIQQSTANHEFNFNIKPSVKFYDENIQAGKPPQALVNPIEQNGLSFDPSKFAIVGKPKSTGTYIFKVAAKNINGAAEATTLKIEVKANPKDKPVFSPQYPITSALRDQKYNMNLMDLIVPHAGFMQTNQLTFRIIQKHSTPDWLHISNDDTPRLVGKVPRDLAVDEIEIELIATSNTGGDSDPFIVRIPIAADPDKRPKIEKFKLENQVSQDMNEDLSKYITDPALDTTLKVIIDKVEPAAPWLRVSSSSPTLLEGKVPDDAFGKKFEVTLRANSLIGGSSEPITISIDIKVDKDLTPRFKNSTLQLPIIYPGQPYFYDIAANEDVYPEFNNIPYEIEFATEFEQPGWIRIEGNKLIAEQAPVDVDPIIFLHLKIKNIPGGCSKVFKLLIRSINYKGL